MNTDSISLVDAAFKMLRTPQQCLCLTEICQTDILKYFMLNNQANYLFKINFKLIPKSCVVTG